VFDHLDMPLRTIKSNGSFWPQDPPSIFQLPPSPEVDAAWERISDTHALVIRREELIRMGRDPAEQWPWPKEYGYGEDAYMGLLDVFHQLHCLNELRMAAYPDYYYQATDEHAQHPHEGAGKVHFTRGGHNLHCQYALLQFILCHADVSVITFNYVEGIRGPMADFSINHQCRDFDSLLQWKLDHQVNVTDEEWQLINRVPEGTRQLTGEGRAWPFGQKTDS
jgi:Mycotoxin biosynthesis protein UstYa